MKPYEKFIESKPGVCGGAPVIRGTRIRLKVVLDNLAEGQNAIASVLEWILENHEIETWKGALVVASAHQLRIRRPS